MATRRASCSCGQLTVEVEGDPVRISICHCLACQRRAGSVFSVQARWPREQVRIEGDATEYFRSPISARSARFFFLPALRGDRLLLGRPGAHRSAGRRVRRPELPRAACLSVGGLHAPVGRAARRDRAHRLSPHRPERNQQECEREHERDHVRDAALHVAGEVDVLRGRPGHYRVVFIPDYLATARSPTRAGCR
jgi:Glutathione-dependent formaldehyde-activating enzyme